ncbi:MAG: polysaccharide biosynthesis protein [Clostridia bacterium]|nr:polysaccharide biosynthesis protein [Clostridia bacterium]
MHKALKKSLFITIDVLIVCLSYLLAIALTEISLFNACLSEWWYLVIAVFTATVINQVCGLHKRIWRYAGLTDAIRLLAACGLQICVFGIIGAISVNYKLNWIVVCAMIYTVALLGSRFSIKMIDMLETAAKTVSPKNSLPRVMVIGAGSAGSLIINELRNSDKISMLPVCFLDDDPKKLGREINGVKVVGKISEVEKFANEYRVDRILVAMPSVDRKIIKNIIVECQKTKCKIQALPGLYQLMTGDVSVSDIKDVEVADLLGREQVKVDLDEIMGYIENKVVMVTGGGGSIGSELCRQIATHNPKELVIVDIYENNAYDIQQELKRKHPELNLTTRIASVRDKVKIDALFNELKPEIVFHAAAHKHVPLMEDSPNEAVKNNVGGTFNVADAAGRYGAKKFILISTDKAVNPTNIMGATKRLCEMIVQTMDKKYATNFVAVRFGNVLGSNGSVIPLFAKQIAEGGPVTITHKDIVRYFMTIPEAVSLVLQAGAYAKGGEIFVLDMGEPVKIYDLAVNMIRLSGLEPYRDIDIKVTGLRPGEKLFEERLMAEEGLQTTANKMISIGKPIKFDDTDFAERINALVDKAKDETSDIKELVHSLVPTYKPQKAE